MKIKTYATTLNSCKKCCFDYDSELCKKHKRDCRIGEFQSINYYLQVVLPEGFQQINTAPKNCELFTAIDYYGRIIKKVHYACDLSGEEQPPFEGFFISAGKNCGYTSVCNLVGWKN